MAYGYWKSGKMNDYAVFDLFFRKNPFQGEFTIFAGLKECIKFLKKFRYSSSDIKYLKLTMPTVDQRFFDYLQSLTARNVTIYAIDEGSVVFPKIPLIRMEGSLIMVQLLETTLLRLVNYASLMATNAARYRMMAGKNIMLFEFGLRRAQGPDGGLSASKYSYIGGFDGTSNVLAGKLFNIPVRGTHAHSYITSFTGISDLQEKTLAHKQTGDILDVLELACKYREAIADDLGASASQASDGEFAALISYAIALPERFTAVADTYDVKKFPSTFREPCIPLHQGDTSIRLLFALMKWTARFTKRWHSKNGSGHGGNPHNLYKVNLMLQKVESSISYLDISWICTIFYIYPNRSGLLNFCAVALALNNLGYRAIGIRIDSGDLAYLSDVVRDTFEKIAIKYDIPWFAKLMICVSNDINEETIISLNEQNIFQGHKIDCFGIGTHLVTCQRQPALGCVYKMVEINNKPTIKLSQEVEKITIPGRKKKPFQQTKRSNVTPSRVESLYKIYWKDGKSCQPLPTLEEIQVAVSDTLYRFINELWSQNAPIGELR
ncbi:PNCB phosphoribosyltransferase, partial [Pseudoatta argentina]